MERLNVCGFYVISFIFLTLTIHNAKSFETVSYVADIPSHDVLLRINPNGGTPALDRHRRAAEPAPANAAKASVTTKPTTALPAASRATEAEEMTAAPTEVNATASQSKTDTESNSSATSSPDVDSSEATKAAERDSSTAPSTVKTTPHEATTGAQAPSTAGLNSSPTPVSTTVTSTTPYMSTTTAFFNVTTTRDRHRYYITDVHNDPSLTQSLLRMFNEKFKSGAVNHHYLLRSMNHAVKFRSTFTFSFYGHPQNRITLGTGGFVYLSDFLHPYLMHSQYAAPLMAPLHTYKNNSDIRYLDDGNGFWVLWENVYMNQRDKAGPFTFQMVLFKNGTIVFAYEKLPILPKDMGNVKPTVRVGLSDAYYWDVSIPWSNMRMRKIIRYDTIALPLEKIRENTVVVMTPLPTCHEQASCKACLDGRTNFTCTWCASLDRCSSGTDRYRQEWERNACHTTGTVTKDCPSRLPVSRVVAITFIFLLAVCLVAGVVLWCRYAYRNPSSPSGIWLLEHRPSVLKAKFSRVMFWKRQDPAGDRYQVSFASNETFA